MPLTRKSLSHSLPVSSQLLTNRSLHNTLSPLRSTFSSESFFHMSKIFLLFFLFGYSTSRTPLFFLSSDQFMLGCPPSTSLHFLSPSLLSLLVGSLVRLCVGAPPSLGFLPCCISSFSRTLACIYLSLVVANSCFLSRTHGPHVTCAHSQVLILLRERPSS